MEVFDFFRFGHSVRLVHDPGANFVDLDDLEELDVLGGDGEDFFGVRDVSGTGVDLIDLSLAPTFGTPGGDNAADHIELETGDGDDDLTVTGKKVIAGTVTVTGMEAKLNITHTEGALDSLAIRTGDGDDHVDSSGLGPDTIQLESD